MTKAVHVSYLLIYIACVYRLAGCLYLEGELNTWENWAFLARFCFLSESGQFEYYIEYEEDQGTPNLLLYYDEEDQWPAVYKSNKNCHAREAVLQPEQNQIVNLSTRIPYSEAAGCHMTPAVTTPRAKYTYVMPTLSTKSATTRKVGTKTIVTQKVTVTIETGTETGIEEASRSESTPRSESDSYFDSGVSESYLSTTSSVPVDIGGVTRAEEEGDTSEVGSTITSSDLGLDSWLVSTSSEKNAGQYLQSELEEVTTPQWSTENPNLKHDEVTLPYFYSTDVINADDDPPIRRKRAMPKYQYGAGRTARTVTCRNARRFRTARERWWFIAVSNCRGTRGIHIRYRILMTNGGPGDYWHEHFSADEFYVLPVLMAFAIAYSFLILAIVICSIELKSRQLLHSTYKLFVLSAMIQFVGIVFKSMCYLKYAVNGLSSPGLKIVGNVFMGTSESCFLLLLLLLAKGYTVTRGRLPLSAGVKVTIFMCLYVVTYISLFIYEAKVFDPGEVLYTYESPAGYGLIILRITAWGMFIYSTVFTLKHYPEKANFYYPFNVFGTLWCIAGPAFIISANTYIDKWVRESVVCAVLLFITFGGHLMFLLITMPSVANKNFPYHVRTTQIGVMEQGNDIGASSIEQFGHHAYEPSSTTNDPSVIIPLSRRTEDLFSGLYSQQMYTSTSAGRRQALTGGVLEHDSNGILNGRNGINDGTMENVLSWSLAKNFNALDPPRMDRQLSEALRDARRGSDLTLSRQETAEASNGGVLEEWIREVPVELFTVSKAVYKAKIKPSAPEEAHSSTPTPPTTPICSPIRADSPD